MIYLGAMRQVEKLKGERTFIPFRQVGQIEDSEL